MASAGPTARTRRILILGGYGTFGGRLAHLLAEEATLTLIIAGRSLTKAEVFCQRFKEFCTTLERAADAVPARFDRDGDVEKQLRAIGPDLVVDVSGPFQAYGGDPYRVVKAAMALGINYIDLADSSDFVMGIAQFNNQATVSGVFVLAGASSFPVLTAAVVRRLSEDMARLDRVTGGIAPSPYANVGRNVIRAIASYAGKPVAILQDGRKSDAHAFIDARRYIIAPPGSVPLNPLRFTLVEVPDLAVLPQLWPSLLSVWMGVAPVPAALHYALTGFAWLVRLRLLRSLTPFAELIYRTINLLAFGEHRGGMFVAVEGVGPDGGRIERSWHLLAEADDGPLIPSMAAAAIISHCAAGRFPPAGARAAATDLELADYEVLFARRKISTGRWQSLPANAREPLYQRVLGHAWFALPDPLKNLHNLTVNTLFADGVATVVRGKGLIARLVAWMIGFPKAGENVPVTVAFGVREGREHWHRKFAGHSFYSVQEEGRGRFERLLCERFGPFKFGLALEVEDGRMRFLVRRWSFLGIPMPKIFAPTGDAYEFAQDGRFVFYVEIRHPLTGLIVGYGGWLVPRG